MTALHTLAVVARDVRCRGREACLARRMSSHRNHAARDPISNPLYRSAGGSMEHWNMIWIRTVKWDDERLPLTLMKEEEHVQCTMGIVFDLHNHNRAIDPVQRRREYMKAWRIAHGQGTADSYMARPYAHCHLLFLSAAKLVIDL